MAFSIPVDVQKGRLVYTAASCLQGDSSSFLEMTPGEVTAGPARQGAEALLLLGAPLSPGAMGWGSEGSSEFNQVIQCWSRVAHNSSILVPFGENRGQCWFGIILIAKIQSMSKTYFICSGWQCKSCPSRRSFLHKSLFYSLPSLLLREILSWVSVTHKTCRILDET